MSRVRALSRFTRSSGCAQAQPPPAAAQPEKPVNLDNARTGDMTSANPARRNRTQNRLSGAKPSASASAAPANAIRVNPSTGPGGGIGMIASNHNSELDESGDNE